MGYGPHPPPVWEGKLAADTLERLPLPSPGGQENLPGQHPEWGIVLRAPWHLYTHVRPPFSHSPSSPPPQRSWDH